MDPPFAYDSLSNLEPYLQYLRSPYGVSIMALPGPLSSSPRLDFNTPNLTNTIGKYSYTPSGFANYTTALQYFVPCHPRAGASSPLMASLLVGVPWH